MNFFATKTLVILLVQFFAAREDLRPPLITVAVALALVRTKGAGTFPGRSLAKIPTPCLRREDDDENEYLATHLVEAEGHAVSSVVNYPH